MLLRSQEQCWGWCLYVRSGTISAHRCHFCLPSVEGGSLRSYGLYTSLWPYPLHTSTPQSRRRDTEVYHLIQYHNDRVVNKQGLRSLKHLRARFRKKANFLVEILPCWRSNFAAEWPRGHLVTWQLLLPLKSLLWLLNQYLKLDPPLSSLKAPQQRASKF